MTKRQHTEDRPGRKSPGAERHAEDRAGEGEDCRCKEVAKKTPAELLKTMISDLSFWKKKR